MNAPFRFPLVVLAFLLLPSPAVAESDDPDRAPTRLRELVVTPSRQSAAGFELPFRVEALETGRVSGALAPRSLPDVLGGVPGVMGQRTGPGQGSPYLRGLTGYHTLILVDGIRLNNSVFRAGPNQYLATVDHLSLAGVEVVMGPGSVAWGSDAMGGAINLLPLSPALDGDGPAWGGRVWQRLASAERSSMSRAEVWGRAGEDLAVILGASRKTFEDLRAGDGRLDDTGYDERDADGRFVWRAAPLLDVTLGFQRVSQDDAPRTHSTIRARSWRRTTVGGEKQRELDQDRTLLYLRGRLREPGDFLEDLTGTLSWHRQEEERFRRRTDGRTDRQGFAVDTLGLDVNATAGTDFGRLTFGVDGYFDRVDSFSRAYDADGSLRSRGIQGPVADDASYDLLGVFVQDEIPLGEGVNLLAGLRATRASADAKEVEDPETGERIRVRDRWHALVGCARLSWLAAEGVKAWGGVSQGFRAPNLSDLTRLDTARSNEIETPSPGLDPEGAISLEAGTKLDLDPVRAEIALYQTWLDDVISRYPTDREIDGNREVRKANVGDGEVRGVEASFEADLAPGLTLFASGSAVYGKQYVYPTSDRRREREYLDRLPPRMGQAGLRYDHQGILLLVVRVRSAAKAHRLSTRDGGDVQRIPPGGTPGFTVLDLSATWRAGPGITMTVGVDNVTDRPFRIHGSGQNEPGRNGYVVLEAR